jgi:hypothetical protein
MPYIGTSPSNGVRRVHTYTATASQTTFSGAGAEGTSLSYKDSNFVDVYQNGIKLGDADYTSTSGTSIVLAQGASVDDLVVVVVFDVFSVSDTVSKADGGTFDGNVTMSNNLTVSGAFTSQGIDDNADATAITIDSSENVGIGTSSPSTTLTVVDDVSIEGSTPTLSLADTDVSNNKVELSYDEFLTIDLDPNNARGNSGLIVKSDGNERMRIDSNGNVGIGQTSNNSRLSVTEQGSDETIANFTNNSGSSPYGLYVDFSSSAPDNTSNYFFRFEDSSTDRLFIFSDGDIYNHDGTYAQISDRRIKDNITDANSQWEDIKAMRFVNYQRKDDILQYGAEDAKVQLGLIGQELEAISPNLVREIEPTANDIRHSSELGSLYEEGDEIPEGKQIGDVKEITDQVKGVAYSILYMKAVKCLQEAMTRIETLEAKVTALENAE